MQVSRALKWILTMILQGSTPTPSIVVPMGPVQEQYCECVQRIGSNQKTSLPVLPLGTNICCTVPHVLLMGGCESQSPPYFSMAPETIADLVLPIKLR